MSPSESLPNLQATIEQLIADAVREAQASGSGNDAALRPVLKQTLQDLETQQTALATTIERLRAALEVTPVSEETTPAETEIVAPAPTPDVDEPTVSESPAIGAHELDVIAHGATYASALGLQTLLRDLDAVADVQIRQFVNGELLLHTQMEAALNRDAVDAWLAANNGKLLTLTNSVVEITFA